MAETKNLFFDEDFFEAMKKHGDEGAKVTIAKYLEKYREVYRDTGENQDKIQKNQDKFIKEIESWRATDKKSYAYIRRFFEMMI